MGMRTADFLFPKDLRVSGTPIRNVLVLGSCAAGGWVPGIKAYAPNVHFDVLNVGAELPESPPKPISEYDFQFLQLPLREIVTDRIISFKGYSDPAVRTSIIENALNSLRFKIEWALRYNRESSVLTFVSNFPVPQVPVAASLDRVGTDEDFCVLVRRLNEYLVELVAEYKNVFLFDYDMIASSLGKRFFQDDVMTFYSHFFFITPNMRDADVHPSFNAPAGGRIDPLPMIEDVYPNLADEMFEAIWRQWENMYRTIHQIDAVKLVIFDLDDTMWRGQIAEHYGNEGKWPVFHGWPLGIWEAVNHLRARGILTAICSKNDAGLVEARWDRAVMSRWVWLDHFTFREINWNPKAANIEKIIKAASLTPKSVVFVDDNPVERESVAAALPGIRVIGSNPFVVRRILLWSSETQVARLSNESVNRDAMIRKQQLRETERVSMSREEFLQGLNCSVRLSRLSSAASPEFPRSLELLNKTNQFNTTGERWTESEITRFFAGGGCLYVFSVEDKFTQYGLVGVILYKDGHFHQFAMSCRVLGLDIEASVVGEIIRREEADTSDQDFSARVVETEANMVSRDVFERCGFFRDPEDATLFLRPSGPPSHVAQHLCLEYAEG